MAGILKRLGKPADTIVHLDFETYYDSEYSVRKLTTESYVRDPRFEVIGVSVAVGRTAPVWLEVHDFLNWSAEVNWSRVAVNAHHAQFDAAILAWQFNILPGFLVCTMSLGRILDGIGSLEELAPKYGLGEKGAGLAAAKGKRRGDFSKKEWLEFGEYCNQDVRIGQGLWYAMRKRIPIPELWVIDTTVRMFTEPIFRGNLNVLKTALTAEQASKADILARAAAWTGDGDPKTILGSSEKFAGLLRSLGVEVQTKHGKKGPIPAFAAGDPGMKALLESPREEIRALAAARISVKSSIDETRITRLIEIAERGPVPFYLKYSGAHTHRWSGGDKLNPQNFRRGGKLRAAIEAPTGKTLVVVDSAQIEARVLAWVAGEVWLLEAFRRNDLNGGDFYSDLGSTFFRKEISKTKTPVERQLSKNMILGLGFGMGWAKFAGELLKGMLGSNPVQFDRNDVLKFSVDVGEFEKRPWGRDGPECGDRVSDLRSTGIRLPYADLLVHCAVADYFVRLYRKMNPRIASFWRAMESALALMAAESSNEIRLQLAGLKFIHEGIIKPSGLILRYPGLRRSGGQYTYIGGDSGVEHIKVYGGLLTENVVQSLARDIVAEQMLGIRSGGWKIGTTTHDEVVAVVPEDRGAEILADAIKCFRAPPAWCSTLPLNAAGGFGTSYGDIK